MAKPTHSPIGASSMHRWKNCPGSVKLSQGIQKPESEYAKEGTLAHEVAAQLLKTRTVPAGLDKEMFESVAKYVEVIMSDTNGVKYDVFIEHPFDLSQVHPGLYGTADCVVYFPRSKTLKVYDYKHGQGIPVDVESNEQLMYYALGALLSLELAVNKIELVIVQPRCGHPDGIVRRWEFDPIVILDFAADLRQFAQATELDNPKIQPGDWCRFCPAAGICPELHKKALSIAKQEFSPTLSYDPEKLALTLESLPLLEAFIKNVREFAYGEACHGRLPPRFKLVQKRAVRKWKDEDGIRKHLDRNLQPNMLSQCYTDPELKSPAQLEKVLGKDKKLIEDYIVQESSGYALAPEDDPREPIKLDAKTEFQAITLLE